MWCPEKVRVRCTVLVSLSFLSEWHKECHDSTKTTKTVTSGIHNQETCSICNKAVEAKDQKIVVGGRGETRKAEVGMLINKTELHQDCYNSTHQRTQATSKVFDVEFWRDFASECLSSSTTPRIARCARRLSLRLTRSSSPEKVLFVLFVCLFVCFFFFF